MAMLARLSSGAVTAPSSPQKAALQRFQKCITSFLWPALASGGGVQCKSTHIDAIDSFTNELVERKSKKWEEIRGNMMGSGVETLIKDGRKSNVVAENTSDGTCNTFSKNFGLMSRGVISDIQALRSPELGLDIRSLSQAQLDNLLSSTLEIKNKLDFLYLVKQCIRWQQLPSTEVLVACLKYLSSLSRVQYIESIAEICQEQNHVLTNMYCDLAPFKAMALWRSDSADLALKTLSMGYEKASNDGKRMIRIAFRTITEETLVKKSEAVLVHLMEIARSIYEEHHDIFVIACVWKQCFVSDWFCDQKSAGELLMHYEELQKMVAKRSVSLCGSFLSRNNVDAVHRLIEVYLRYNEREACSNCLSLLFNYQYKRRDLRACAEIIKSCSELDMPLSETQNEQFLGLFINQNESDKTKPTLRKDTPKAFKQFQYKF
ncbi:uncharacterized protein LOC133325309 [Musca vetustissima]|uniref:uncharacterized protein LOC133325309 n=1 Tax=Musca vetustissima TaxID=27455 RepID=UPI002AB7C116|nr:uncharacterized protein LOC133325309 [Musca vetustissima]